jgi:hypothetical protein
MPSKRKRVTQSNRLHAENKIEPAVFGSGPAAAHAAAEFTSRSIACLTIELDRSILPCPI